MLKFPLKLFKNPIFKHFACVKHTITLIYNLKFYRVTQAKRHLFCLHHEARRFLWGKSIFGFQHKPMVQCALPYQSRSQTCINRIRLYDVTLS